MNKPISEYSDEFLIKVWDQFWWSTNIEPVFVAVPEGMATGHWISVVYTEMQQRGLSVKLERHIETYTQLSME